MKQFFYFLLCFLLFTGQNFAQVSLNDTNNSVLINFQSSTAGVSQGAFSGSGLTPTPSNGQLDGDAWAITGLSEGAHNFGQSHTSGDFARGLKSTGTSTGGLYAFNTGSNNFGLGIQPTGSDWTPGTITLKITNNGTSSIDDLSISYKVYVRNDQDRSSSFNFSHSSNNSSYTNESSLALSSPSTRDASPNWVVNNKSIDLLNVALAPGASYYLRWSGSDVSGSGSRDEFALDDISIQAAGGGGNNCVEPNSQASNLSFNTITSNSIQGLFSTSNADNYLILRSTSSSLSANPIDGLSYTPGNTLGNATIVQYGSSNQFLAQALQSNTNYTFFIFSANDNCIGAPEYLNTNPLSASTSTIPDNNSGYYNVVGNQVCADLKTVLHNLIKDHTRVSYNALWTVYQSTDDRQNDAGSQTILWDMYSDNPNGSENEFTFVSDQCGTYQSEGDCYNREHSFPKSWWGGATNVPMYTDIFTVVPVDGWINGVRNNNPYGEVQGGTETQITNNGSRLGSSSITIPGYSSSVFEPIDEYKGDFARSYFYMATRYENLIDGWEGFTTESDAVLDGTTYPAYEPWMVTMLLDWHTNDPVSQKEIDRNETIFGIQANRNPFIDHPEYAGLIWGPCGTTDTQAPSNPANLSASNVTTTSANLNWSASTDNIGVTGYFIYQNGSNIGSVSGNAALVNNLSPSTTYTYSVRAFDAAGNQSSNSNTISITTGAASDTQAPSNPANLSVSNVTTNSANLNWSASTDNVGVTGYFIYQNGSNIGSVSGNSALVNGLSSSSTYTFYVRAFDAAGNQSGNSNTLSITTDTEADTQAPSNPSNLTASNTTQTSTTLSWSASSDNIGVSGYNVYQDGLVVAFSSGTSQTIASLSSATTYIFYVRAVDAAGNESGNSNDQSVTTDSPTGPTVLSEGYFESGWDGWQDGGSDCARYSGSYAAEGNYAIRIRDNSGSASAMTSPNIDLSAYTSAEISFSFIGRSMENNEDFWVRFYDGSSWTTIQTYRRGTDFNNNTFYTASVTINSSDYNFASNARFRFQCDASVNNDRIYIDEVIITGDTPPVARRAGATNLAVLDSKDAIDLYAPTLSEQDQEETKEIKSLKVFPNPTSDWLTVQWADQKMAVQELRLMNANGQLMENIQVDDRQISVELDLSDYQKGIYFLQVIREAGVVESQILMVQ